MTDSIEAQLTWGGSNDTRWTWGTLNGARWTHGTLNDTWQTQINHGWHGGVGRHTTDMGDVKRCMTDMRDINRCMADSNEAQLAWVGGSGDTQQTWGILNDARCRMAG